MIPKLPEEFTNRMRAQLEEDFDAFLSCYEKPAVKSLRLNRRKISSVAYAQMSRIVTGSDAPEEVPFCEGAWYYDDTEPGKSPLHEAGAYYIQEASAMIPVTLLDVTPDKLKVLDLCAAPGGKTTQIADCMNGCGLLVANEIIPSRAAILSENIERMGVENALVLNHDPAELADRFPAFFDRILVDAPCSGEGMFRKNPEAVSEWSPENVTACAKRQDMILDCAAAMLSPSGRLVYSTCTFSPEEDEGAVDRFIKRHPEFTVCEGPMRLYMHTAKCEGHFAVSLIRRTSSQIAAQPVPAKIKKSILSPVESTLLSGFLDDILRPDSPHKQLICEHPERLIRFGNSIYLAPEMLPDIKGLKVKRAGLKLGTFLKNRFEPDHALSHALSPHEVIKCLDLPYDSDAIRQYISGMTISCDPALKGWCVVSTEGLGIGWGKAAGGTLKNHYPKGLRK